MNIPKINLLFEVTENQSINSPENSDPNEVQLKPIKRLLVNQNEDTNNTSLAEDADFVEEEETNTDNNKPKIQIGEEYQISYKSVKCTGNPDVDAKNFAEANNITIDEAKRILSSKFGAPGSGGNAPKIGEDMIIDYVAVKCTGNPDVDAKNFAEANHISIETAKALFEEKYGKPVQNNNSNPQISIPPEEAAKLEQLGIPKEVIEQGDDAIRKYAQEHNIELAPPNNSNSQDSTGTQGATKTNASGTSNTTAAQNNGETTNTSHGDISIPPEEAAKLEQLGIPREVIEQGDDAIRKYAQEHNIELTPPNNSNSQSSTGTQGTTETNTSGTSNTAATQGDNTTQNNEGTTNRSQGNLSIPPEEAAKLEQLGIPREVIEQGDDAIKQYAEEHNITLPAKANNPQAEGVTNNNAKEFSALKDKIKSAEQQVSNTYYRIGLSGGKMGWKAWRDAIDVYAKLVIQLEKYLSSSEFSTINQRLKKLDGALKSGQANTIIYAYSGLKNAVNKAI